MSDREARIGAVIAAVTENAVREANADGVVVLAGNSTESELLVHWLRSRPDAIPVWPVTPPDPADARAFADEFGPDAEARAMAGPFTGQIEELLRYRARLTARNRNALVAHPANKTALLLAGTVPPEPLLPLGDLYASQVATIGGGAWSGPAAVREMAEAAGGIDRLDGALARLIDRRLDPAAALEPIPADVGEMVRSAFERGRFSRRRAGLVPKLGARTIGIDLFA